MLQNDAKEKIEVPHFGPQEIVAMAMRLVAKHGGKASDVALFFAEEQQCLEDVHRAWAWQVVACTTEDILQGRYFEQEITIH